MIKHYIDRQIQEIQSDQALRTYGFFLGCTHLLTIFFWHGIRDLRNLVDDPLAICWPYLPNCLGLKPFWQLTLWPLFIVYMIATLGAILLWLKPSRARLAYTALALATIIKVILLNIDYREMGNYHYMPFAAIILFLFVPNKIEGLRFLIVGFYLAAGVLKFNREWLSGAAIFGKPWLSGRSLEIGCFLVVILEMAVSLLLLSRRSVVLITALALFTVFHLFSWHVVGYFYPLIMFALLTIFILSRNRAGRSDAWDFLSGRAHRSSYVALSVLVALQLPPWIVGGDSALTGEWRLTSLNMFDAFIQCRSHIWIKRLENGLPELTDLNDPLMHVGPRIRCEPHALRSYASSLCELKMHDPHFVSIGVDLLARRNSAREYVSLIHEPVFCGRK